MQKAGNPGAEWDPVSSIRQFYLLTNAWKLSCNDSTVQREKERHIIKSLNSATPRKPNILPSPTTITCILKQVPFPSASALMSLPGTIHHLGHVLGKKMFFIMHGILKRYSGLNPLSLPPLSYFILMLLQETLMLLYHRLMVLSVSKQVRKNYISSCLIFRTWVFFVFPVYYLK